MRDNLFRKGIYVDIWQNQYNIEKLKNKINKKNLSHKKEKGLNAEIFVLIFCIKLTVFKVLLHAHANVIFERTLWLCGLAEYFIAEAQKGYDLRGNPDKPGN